MIFFNTMAMVVCSVPLWGRKEDRNALSLADMMKLVLKQSDSGRFP
jgi:hypothetical protein